MKTQYRAEVNFLIAYYHFRLLVDYGPIPIIDHFMSMATPVSEIPGRSHFDYVVDFICKSAMKRQRIFLLTVRHQNGEERLLPFAML